MGLILSMLGCETPDPACIKDVLATGDRALIDEYFTRVVNVKCLPVDITRDVERILVEEVKTGEDVTGYIVRAEYEDGGSTCARILLEGGDYFCVPCSPGAE